MNGHFLYEKWRAIAREFASERALFEQASNRVWTFRELLAESESDQAEAPIVFPQGQDAGFIFTLLRSWRAGAITCPLEVGQPEPGFRDLPSGCAHLKLTSASTGAQKSIAFTGPQLAADAANITATMGLRPEWPNLACISLAHSYGFSNLVLPLLLHGIPLILAPAPLPEVVREIARRFPALTLASVPALWKIWHESGAIVPVIKLAISAGAPLPLPVEQSVFDAWGLKIHNFYGSSECGGIAYDHLTTPRVDAACAGSALKNVLLTISDSGTLVVESEAVGETYWPEPQTSLRAGRFETSDLALISEGTVHLRGRLSDLLNVAGRKASPEAIEEILRAHPEVVECVIFGIPALSHERADAIVAVVNARRSISISDLSAFLSDKLPGWQIPRHWSFTSDLAPNSRGKISRAEWKQRFLTDRGEKLSID